jgi:hypothetical protein
MARKAKTRTVYTVLADGKGEGPAGDGTFTHRFWQIENAQAFADRSTCWGRPATVSTETDVPARLIARWSIA